MAAPLSSQPAAAAAGGIVDAGRIRRRLRLGYQLRPGPVAGGLVPLQADADELGETGPSRPARLPRPRATRLRRPEIFEVDGPHASEDPDLGLARRLAGRRGW